MQIEIGWEGEVQQVDLLDGKVHVGGGDSDDIQCAGLPINLLQLDLAGDRLKVTSSKPMEIGGVQFPAHVARLVVPGEVMQLPNGVTLKQLSNPKERQTKGTACVLKELVGNVYAPEKSRAAVLICLTGLDAGRTYPLGHNETPIGRGETAMVRVRDRAVSRLHAKVIRQRGKYLLEPLTSTNGVYVNGKLLAGWTVLKHGDQIEMGQSLLRFEGPGEEPVEPTVLMEAPPSPPSVELAAELKEEANRDTEPLPPPPAAEGGSKKSELVLLGIAAVFALIGAGVTLAVLV